MYLIISLLFFFKKYYFYFYFYLFLNRSICNFLLQYVSDLATIGINTWRTQYRYLNQQNTEPITSVCVYDHPRYQRKR